MVHKSRKQYFNELAKEFAFSGPRFCTVNSTQYVYLHPKRVDPVTGIPMVRYSRIDYGEPVVVFRGPLPAGEHRTELGGRWLLYSLRLGPVYIQNTMWDFDYMFKTV